MTLDTPTSIPSTATLSALIRAFASKRVLVIGDMVSDEYIIGNPTRISREAPVLILDLTEERIVPGGACNVAVNTRSLGSDTLLAGVVGEDIAGRKLREAIATWHMNQDGVVSDRERPTSTKTRIMAGSSQVVQQHIVRVDRVDTSDISTASKKQIIDYIKRVISTIDAVVISDYANGMISPEIIETCVPTARALNKVVVVDSHGSFSRFQGVTALTPNQPEAEAETGITIRTQAELNEVGRRLLERSHAQGVLITRGSEGMSLFEAGKAPLHLPIYPHAFDSEIVDTNGAGDTVAATFTLALSAGASMAEAAYLANAAASLVVRRMGCASNTPEELIGILHE